MNKVKGKLNRIGSGEKGKHGPWRRYALEPAGATFFTYPGKEWTELEALEGKHTELDIKYEGDAWLYIEGSAHAASEPTASELQADADARSRTRVQAFIDCVNEAKRVADAVASDVAFGPSEIQKIATTFYLARWRK